MMKQGDLKVPGDQQGETDLSKVVTFLLGVAPLGQGATVIGCGQEREKIGGVVEQDACVDAKLLLDAGDKPILDLFDILLGYSVHVIPEPLAAESGFVETPQSTQDGVFIPVAYGQFAQGLKGTVQGSEDDVVANAGALLALFADLVDEFEKVEALGNTEQGRNAAGLENDGVFRPRGFAALCAINDGFDGAQVFLPDNAGLSVHAFRFDGIVIWAPFLDLFGDRGHDSLPLDLASRVIHGQ
jgi:hypothetical protein